LTPPHFQHPWTAEEGREESRTYSGSFPKGDEKRKIEVRKRKKRKIISG